ncbi:stimulus-sensing domain-containing protein [Microvirga sp. W0021]|uniref:histidine kinase n=1 Tax=Hohaiivirga grylli TaxID=3133970 RepID=A0ABV0BG56_9HYPH
MAAEQSGNTEAGQRAIPPRGLVKLRKFWRSIVVRASSSLTRRIVVLNLAGLFALLLGFLYLNQFREGLIEARVQSLLTQGEIIAGAIASSATVDTDTITIDPDKLLQMQAGETLGLGDDAVSPLEFSLNPERVAPLLRRLVTPTRTRARIYDRDGVMLLDTRAFYSRGDIFSFNLPPVNGRKHPSWFQETWSAIRAWFNGMPKNVDDLEAIDGLKFSEVSDALRGKRQYEVRVNGHGETIVSVAVPVQRYRSVRGALLLSTQGGDIDGIISAERMALVRIFLVAAAVMIVLSMVLAGAIVGPVRKLAEAAERVRKGVRLRQEIPDFTDRSDEIGHLSGALRDMTHALYNRIEAIERFAADVAHELKNPLTSLRSATETLPLARNDESRERLMAIIQHDVSRLDRLITDISDASRLDAELVRQDAEVIDIGQLLEAVVGVAQERRAEHEPNIVLTIDSDKSGNNLYQVLGHDSRLGQVVSNLIDNATSFSPPDATIDIHLSRKEQMVEITVEDEGPGIPPHALERVFERFYTDRPDQGFGQNSGLGLSISRQIIEAYRGTLTVENLVKPGGSEDDPEDRKGARFIIKLPVYIAPKPSRNAKAAKK